MFIHCSLAVNIFCQQAGRHGFQFCNINQVYLYKSLYIKLPDVKLVLTPADATPQDISEYTNINYCVVQYEMKFRDP